MGICKAMLQFAESMCSKNKLLSITENNYDSIFQIKDSFSMHFWLAVSHQDSIQVMQASFIIIFFKLWLVFTPLYVLNNK